MSKTNKKYGDTDYLYGSARIRAIEAGMISDEKLLRLAEAKSYGDLVRSLEESGIKCANGSFEDSLSEIVQNAFLLVSELAPDTSLFDILKYPYDCHNIKSAIKAQLGGIAADKIFFAFGTVPVSDVLNAVAERDFSALPKNMAAAAKAAVEAYAHTRDPQLIDLGLDAACYADMAENAVANAHPFFKKLVSAKADITNILSCIRLLRIGSNDMDRFFVPGGTLKQDFFGNALKSDSGEAYFFDMLRLTPYSDIGILGQNSQLTQIEKAGERLVSELYNGTKYKIGGAEVLAAYVSRCECLSKNLRIIIAGKSAELPTEVIKERLRENV